MELLRPALFGWAAARFGLDGFLHWGFNHYGRGQDPFQQSVVGHGGGNFLPAGDTHIVYPGTGGPWSSLRLEAQREGFEDYNFFCRNFLAIAYCDGKRPSLIVERGTYTIIKVAALGAEPPRLRIGIGAEQVGKGRDFVLSTFSAAERPVLDEAVQRAVRALEVWLESGMERCQNEFNASLPAEGAGPDETRDHREEADA
jgi:hypothetical protein